MSPFLGGSSRLGVSRATWVCNNCTMSKFDEAFGALLHHSWMPKSKIIIVADDIKQALDQVSCSLKRHFTKHIIQHTRIYFSNGAHIDFLSTSALEHIAGSENHLTADLLWNTTDKECDLSNVTYSELIICQLTTPEEQEQPAEWSVSYPSGSARVILLNNNEWRFSCSDHSGKVFASGWTNAELRAKRIALITLRNHIKEMYENESSEIDAAIFDTLKGE